MFSGKVSYVEIRKQRIDKRENEIEEIASEMDGGFGITQALFESAHGNNDANLRSRNVASISIARRTGRSLWQGQRTAS